MCIRYARYLGDFAEPLCNVTIQNNNILKKCARCAKGKHPCIQIPKMTVHAVNIAYRVREACVTATASNDQFTLEYSGEALTAQMEELNKTLTASKLVDSRKGFAKKPNQTQLLSRIDDHLGGIKESLDNAVDSFREANNLKPIGPGESYALPDLPAIPPMDESMLDAGANQGGLDEDSGMGSSGESDSDDENANDGEGSSGAK